MLYRLSSVLLAASDQRLALNAASVYNYTPHTQPKPADEAARKKKTDEPSPDDPHEETPAADEKSFAAQADDDDEEVKSMTQE